MPRRLATPKQIKTGALLREPDGKGGERVLVITSSELCVRGPMRGKWVHKLRLATNKERIVSDVMET